MSASAFRAIVASGSSAMSIAVTGFSCAWDTLRWTIFPLAFCNDPERVGRTWFHFAIRSVLRPAGAFSPSLTPVDLTALQGPKYHSADVHVEINYTGGPTVEVLE